MAEQADTGRRAQRAQGRARGLVVSDKMQSTVVVAVVERVRHCPLRQDGAAHPQLYAHDDEQRRQAG